MRLRGRRAAASAWLATCVAVLLACHAAAAPAAVSVHLEIRDELTASGLAVSIRRDVTPGTDALAFIESVVAVEHRSYPGAGVFVTSLCGVAAPDGMFWELTIDGERATRGIADLDIEADMHIRWELVPIR